MLALVLLDKSSRTRAFAGAERRRGSGAETKWRRRTKIDQSRFLPKAFSACKGPGRVNIGEPCRDAALRLLRLHARLAGTGSLATCGA